MQRRQWLAGRLQNGHEPVCSGACWILSPLRVTVLRGKWCRAVWVIVFYSAPQGQANKNKIGTESLKSAPKKGK